MASWILKFWSQTAARKYLVTVFVCFHGVGKHIKPEVEQPHHPLVEVGVGAGVLPDQLVLVDSERHQLKSCLDVAFLATGKQPTAPR